MQTPSEILNGTELGRRLLKNATPESSEPSQSEKEPRRLMPNLPRGPHVQNPQFRADLLRLDESHHPKVEELAKAAEWLIRAMSVNDLSRGRCFGFSGSPGCGKTKVARGIYRFAMSNGPDLLWAQKRSKWAALWLDWPNIAERDDETDFLDARQQLEDASFVVLDDVGSETDRFKTGLPASRLRRILSIVESNKTWCVVTSNMSRGELVDLYDSRVADRFIGFQWLNLGNVPSYR